MKAFNPILLVVAGIILITIIGCNNKNIKEGSIEDLKALLQTQKDSTNIILSIEGLDFGLIHYTRLDRQGKLSIIHFDRELNSKLNLSLGEDSLKSKSYTTGDSLKFDLTYDSNNVDPAVRLSKYYLFDYRGLDKGHKFKYEIFELHKQ